jgi:hypothetical protein
VEEARERQNRLAKMRALLFYHEAKARRLKKIKSKEYRRKLKKAGGRGSQAGGVGMLWGRIESKDRRCKPKKAGGGCFGQCCG